MDFDAEGELKTGDPEKIVDTISNSFLASLCVAIEGEPLSTHSIYDYYRQIQF